MKRENFQETAARFHRNVMVCGEHSMTVDNTKEAKSIIMYDDVFVEYTVKNLGAGVRKIVGKRK